LKTIGHSLKNLGPSQKTLRHPWCPKPVTGLEIRHLILRSVGYGMGVKHAARNGRLCGPQDNLSWMVTPCFCCIIDAAHTFVRCVWFGTSEPIILGSLLI